MLVIGCGTVPSKKKKKAERTEEVEFVVVSLCFKIRATLIVQVFETNFKYPFKKGNVFYTYLAEPFHNYR